MQYYIRQFGIGSSVSHDLVFYTGRIFFIGSLYYDHRERDIVGTPVFKSNIKTYLDTIKVERFII